MSSRSRFKKPPPGKFNRSTTTKLSYGPSTGLDEETLHRLRDGTYEANFDDDYDEEISSGSEADDDGDGDVGHDDNAALVRAVREKSKGSLLLTEQDRRRAMHHMQQEKDELEQHGKQRGQEWEQAKKQIRSSKPLLGRLLSTEKYREQKAQNARALNKYRRERYRVDKFQQGLFSVKNKQFNRMELSNKAVWSDRDRTMAEIALAESEVLRDIDVPRGIELAKDDIVQDTAQLTQERLLEEVDLQSKQKVFDIELKRHGPYMIRYNVSGRHALLCGTRGHVASVAWRNFDMEHENLVGSRISDVAWMMDDSMYATAERPFTNVYDSSGGEIHVIREFAMVNHLQYLPYHFLLVGASANQVNYLDITQGVLPAQIKLNPITCMTQNPYNAIIVTGHSNGTVSLVTPRDKDFNPVVTMLCHKAPLQNVAVDQSGRFLLTTSRDNVVKVWDVRKMYEPVAQTTSPANVSSAAISQSGMLAMSCSNQIFVWKHLTRVHKKVYMKHKVPASMVQHLEFCPFEDVLGIGHARGVSSILIPGSGIASYDSRLPNPYFKEKDSADFNVRNLLEKIPHDMISLDPSAVGTTGTRIKDFNFSKKVDITSELRAELDKVGVIEASANKKRVFSSRDEQREALLKMHEKLKDKRAKHWFEDKDADALDRFAPWKRTKTHEEDVFAEDDSDGDDDEQEEDYDDDDDDVDHDEDSDSGSTYRNQGESESEDDYTGNSPARPATERFISEKPLLVDIDDMVVRPQDAGISDDSDSD